jgi:hypothetical protein
MTLQGTVINGVVVLDQKSQLPEGARVTVTFDSQQPSETLSDLLTKYAGCMKGLPADMAEQHDHYLHGTPKQ